MTLHELLTGLRAETLDFEDTIAWITQHYDYYPCAFTNGQGAGAVANAAAQNEGACRVFALGQLKGLSGEDTLLLFGRHLRDVLSDPKGHSHANIRQFQQHGWQGIHFSGLALKAKN